MASISKIAFSWRTKKPDIWADRGIAIGGTGSGKSTLCEKLIEQARADYPDLKVLILDSKPRFQAEHETNGRSAAHLYKKWDHGTMIPGSFVLPTKNSGAALEDVWRYGGKVAIAQAPEGPENTDELIEMLAPAHRFLSEARASEPRLIYVDELMDFFATSGHPVGRDNVLLRFSRAGRERGCGSLVATQRPRGIPTQLVQEANKLYMFKLRNVQDVDHLEEFGAPGMLEPNVPTENRWFYYMDHENPRTAGRYRLKL